MKLNAFTIVFFAVLGFSSCFAAGVTHMGVLPTEHVTLKGVRSKSLLACFNNPDPVACGQFFQTFPDGTSATDPFQIPDHKILVVTDVDWHYQGVFLSSESFVGTKAIFRLSRSKVGVPTSNQVLVSVETVESTCPAGSLSQCVDASGDIQTTSGFVVFSEASVNFELEKLPFIPCDDTPCLEEAHLEVFVRGYLLPDRRRPQ
jgi:hypothetical protein